MTQFYTFHIQLLQRVEPQSSGHLVQYNAKLNRTEQGKVRGRPANSSRTFLQPEVMIKKVSANMRDFRHFEKHNISYLLARMTCRYLPDSEVFLADTYKQSKSI